MISTFGWILLLLGYRVDWAFVLTSISVRLREITSEIARDCVAGWSRMDSILGSSREMRLVALDSHATVPLTTEVAALALLEAPASSVPPTCLAALMEPALLSRQAQMLGSFLPLPRAPGVRNQPSRGAHNQTLGKLVPLRLRIELT